MSDLWTRFLNLFAVKVDQPTEEALQAAVDRAGARRLKFRRRVVIPAGEIVMTKTLRLEAPMHIQGAGSGTDLRWEDEG